jgi:hypothetical protein
VTSYSLFPLTRSSEDLLLVLAFISLVMFASLQEVLDGLLRLLGVAEELGIFCDFSWKSGRT